MELKINGILGQVLIGCYPHERLESQEIEISLQIALYSYNWIDTDKLDTTVNYDELIDYVQSLLPNTNYQLLESLAQYLAVSILEHYSLIQKISVELKKSSICGVKAREISVSFAKSRQFKVALALGSNATNLPQQQLISAIEILGEHVSAMKVGGFYLTKPVGFLAQANFYNTAVVGFTPLKPEELLSKIKAIEKLMGKEEICFNGPRLIDIDLILFDDLVYTHNFLHVPHKSMHLRDFVLQPLKDIAPDWIHPLFKQSISQIYDNLAASERSIIEQVN